jgi:hypothetical protein
MADMFGMAGRNRHGGQRLAKPVMYDPEDSEWRNLSPRPVNRWTKRRPTKRVVIVLVCLFIASVYGVRLWKEHQHREQQRIQAEQARLELERQQQEVERQKQRERELQKAKEEEERAAQAAWDNRPKPPLFERYHEAELALPQHYVADPFADGKKYLWVENHVHGEPFILLVLRPCFAHFEPSDAMILFMMGDVFYQNSSAAQHTKISPHHFSVTARVTLIDQDIYSSGLG